MGVFTYGVLESTSIRPPLRRFGGRLVPVHGGGVVRRAVCVRAVEDGVAERIVVGPLRGGGGSCGGRSGGGRRVVLGEGEGRAGEEEQGQGEDGDEVVCAMHFVDNEVFCYREGLMKY